MGHENGGKQRPTKRRHMQGMLDETDPLEFKLSQHLFRVLSRLLKQVEYKLQISSDSKSCSNLTINKMSLVLDARHMNYIQIQFS